MTGLAPVIAVGCAALAAALVASPRRRAGDRLATIHRPSNAATAATAATAGTASRDGGGIDDRRRPVLRLAAAVVVLIAGPVALGGVLGVVGGLVGATAVALVRPSRGGSSIDPADLAVVVDLIAGCLAAGTSLPAALDAAAIAAGDELRRSCHAVAVALRSGVAAEAAWRSWLADPWLAAVGRTVVRTSSTGAAAAADLRRTSMRLRARRRSAAQHKVRRASVWLVVPLGLCFLPAFVLVAVVPLVVGLVPSLR